MYGSEGVGAKGKSEVAKVIETPFYLHILTARPDNEGIDHLWKE